MFGKLHVPTLLLLFLFAFDPRMALAQNSKAVSSVISCLDGAPMPSAGETADAYDECVSGMLSECINIDPPDTVGEGNYTSAKCFLSAVDQIKSTMNQRLNMGWPDKNSVGHQLRKLSIEYAIKRAELRCEFDRAVQAVSIKPRLGKTDQLESNLLNRTQAGCVASQLAAAYWLIIVHGQVPK